LEISRFDSYSQLFKIKFNELFPESSKYDLDDVLTIVLSYLYRINNYENFSLCISGESVHIPKELSPELFLEVKPLSINLDNDLNFTETKKSVKLLLSHNKNKNACFKDLLARYSDFQKVLVRNAILLNISEKAPIQENIYPIIIDLNKTNECLSLFIANSFLKELPFFINFMQDHLKNLVKNWVVLDIQLNKVNFLSSEELQYLKNWNNTHVDFSKTQSITTIIDNVCKNFPDNIAIETKDQKISYQELKNHSDQIAKNILSFLHDKKITNNLIGIFLDKSANTILTFLGVLKAGLTYVVLDTAYPDDYLENVIQSTQAKIFICQSSKHDRLYKIIHKIGHYEKQFCLSLDQIFLKKNQEIRLPDNIPTTTLAYVLFTSGSTGKPKGVMISHESVINLANAVNTSIGITNKDRLLQFSTLAFDTSVWEIYASFFAAGTLYVPEPSEIRLGKNLQKTIVSKNISLSIFPPSVLKVQPYFESNALKTIVVGGEACPPILPKQWGKYYRFINVYGPTEATVIATMSEELKQNDDVTIGRPIQNYQITICDRYQAELPVGAIGEIIISGAGVAQGYMNNFELTQQKFKPIRILGKEKIGYLSGDLGRWTRKGQIQYIGRIDSQLKIRGFRVEPAMIEQVINTYAGIHACIILPNKTEKERLFLNAYILTDGNSLPLDLKDLKTFLKAKLPHFMIPKKFFFINYLPLTVVGKIDYAKLLSNSQPDLEDLSEEVSLHL
jgi:amino acid adenylation domain-containing protein